MGIDLEHSPDGKLYLIGHGSKVPGASAWMQGSSVYMARCEPTVGGIRISKTIVTGGVSCLV